MSSVRLHKEHGLNPTVGRCFWCGETTGVIALLGAACKGEAPREMVLDYEPCTACADKFKTGIHIIEVTTTPQTANQPPFSGAYPTGRWMVVPRSCLNPDGPGTAEILKHGKALCGVEDFAQFLERAK